MLTRAALKNPFAIFAICMIVLILGWVSYQKMKIDIFPDINIPVILVSTFYRGLSPGEMEGAITLRFEQQFLQASYIEHIESQSLAGMSYIKVFFQPEYSIDAAQSELTSLAYSIIRLLPPGVFPPSVYKFGVASLPIGLLTVSSDTMSEKEMRISPTSPFVRKWPPSRAFRPRRCSAVSCARLQSSWTKPRCKGWGSRRRKW
jgi:multidrug efflux pump subunit AcrB